MKSKKTTKTTIIKRTRKRTVIAAVELLIILSGCGIRDSEAGNYSESITASTAAAMEDEGADSESKVPEEADNANKDLAVGHLQDQPDDVQDELFNFKGVFRKILAENGEALSEEVKSEFMEDNRK